MTGSESKPPDEGRRRSGSRRGRGRKRGGRGRGAPTGASPEAVARERFGIRRLYDEQRVAIASVLEGRDTMAVLPTGFGKSLIYQVPALMVDRPTLVVSPLIALMADQEQGLRKRGIPVVRFDSTLRAAQRRDALARLEAGGSLIVLTTPETLESRGAGEALRACRPFMLCVDEAHCISEWGHDFRPAYLRLGTERKALGDPVVLALTATAPPRVQADIAARLQLRDPTIITAPPHRENLRLSVQLVAGNLKTAAVARRLKQLQRPGIVYCSTTKAVDGIWSALQAPKVRHRIPAVRYHGKLPKAERDAAQARFMTPRKRLVMVATSAFGMGIDKPDIRYIVHYQAPGSLEQYVQEAGRAGRDGKPASCELLFDPEDLEIQRFLLRKSRPSPGQLLAVADALRAYADEGRSPTAEELAVSAGVPQTVARSMAAELEALGLVVLDEGGLVRVTVSAHALDSGARDLAARLDTLARQDEKRLQAVAAYATTEMCRSVFIRRYFGEDDPPRCGSCDRCRASRDAEKTASRLTRTTEQALAGDEARASPAKSRRRRRGKRRKANTGGEPKQAARPPEAPPSVGTARKRRRRRPKTRSGDGRGEGAGGG